MAKSYYGDCTVLNTVQNGPSNFTFKLNQDYVVVSYSYLAKNKEVLSRFFHKHSSCILTIYNDHKIMPEIVHVLRKVRRYTLIQIGGLLPNQKELLRLKYPLIWMQMHALAASKVRLYWQFYQVIHIKSCKIILIYFRSLQILRSLCHGYALKKTKDCPWHLSPFQSFIIMNQSMKYLTTTVLVILWGKIWFLGIYTIPKGTTLMAKLFKAATLSSFLST